MAVVFAVAVLTAACSSGSTGHGRVGLTIDIAALPPGVAGHVVVSGVGTAAVLLTHTGTVRVAAGSYRVTVSGVRVGTVTYYPQDLVVQTRAPGSVSVRYVEQIPDTTKVLDPRNLGLVPGTSAAGPVLAFVRGSAGTQLRPGDVLAVAVGPLTPDGLLRKVVSVERRPGEVLVAVVPAELRDAVPRGSLHARLRVDPSAGVGLGSTSCGNGVSFTGHAAASMNGWVDFDMAWGFATPNYVKLVGGLSETGGASLAVNKAGYCKVKADSDGISLPPFPLDIGPVVLEVTPKLVAHGEVKGTLTRSPTFGFTESGWAKAGFTWGTPDGSNQDLHPIAGAGASFTATPPAESSTLNMWAAAGPQVNFNIDGFNGGPYVNFLGGLSVNTDPTSPTSYHFDGASNGKVNVGVRAEWGPLNFNVSQDFTLFSKTLFQGDFTPPTTTDSPPTAPPATAPDSPPTPAPNGCVVLAPNPLRIDLAHTLPGRPSTLDSAVPNQDGALTRIPGPGPGGDQPGSAASCQWVGRHVTPRLPYYFPFDTNVTLSIVPYTTAAIALRAWNAEPHPTVTGWPNPTGIGTASRWVLPGPQDGHALLEVLASRFVYAVAITEADPRLATDTQALARAVQGQL